MNFKNSNTFRNCWLAAMLVMMVLGIFSINAKAANVPQTSNVVDLKEKFVIPKTTEELKISVYLPPSYATSKKSYPVLYVNDAKYFFSQNGVLERLDQLSQAGGLELIVVGIFKRDSDTEGLDYDPERFDKFAINRGQNYLAFLIDTLKPRIDSLYRTRPNNASTGIMGTAASAKLARYSSDLYPEIFGKTALLLPEPKFFCANKKCTEFKNLAIKGGQKLVVLTPSDLWFRGKNFVQPAGVNFRIFEGEPDIENINKEILLGLYYLF